MFVFIAASLTRDQSAVDRSSTAVNKLLSQTDKNISQCLLLWMLWNGNLHWCCSPNFCHCFTADWSGGSELRSTEFLYKASSEGEVDERECVLWCGNMTHNDTSALCVDGAESQRRASTLRFLFPPLITPSVFQLHLHHSLVIRHMSKVMLTGQAGSCAEYGNTLTAFHWV